MLIIFEKFVEQLKKISYFFKQWVYNKDCVSFMPKIFFLLSSLGWGQLCDGKGFMIMAF